MNGEDRRLSLGMPPDLALHRRRHVSRTGSFCVVWVIGPEPGDIGASSNEVDISGHWGWSRWRVEVERLRQKSQTLGARTKEDLTMV